MLTPGQKEHKVLEKGAGQMDRLEFREVRVHIYRRILVLEVIVGLKGFLETVYLVTNF